MKQKKVILLILMCLLLLIVLLQNTEVVRTKILFVTVPMSRALLLVLTFGMGFTTGPAAMHPLRRKQP